MQRKQIKKIFISLILVFSVNLFAQESSGSGGTQTGFILKGGIWGLGGKIKSELEDKYFTDDLISSRGIGQFNTGWTSSNNIYLLNPIGLDYYMGGMGPGSLYLGADFRGFPGLSFTGYTPKYDFISVSPGGTLGIHSADLNLKNLDLNIGYQLAFGSFLVTPKFQFRNFATELKESALYLSNNAFGIRNTRNTQNTWSGFIGVNLLFNLNEASSLYLDFGIDSPILGQISSNGDFNKTYLFASGNNAAGSTTLIKNSTQEIRGTVIDLGYQHSFGALGLKFGYRNETLNTSYSNYTDVPLTFNSNGNVGFSVYETILNSIFYKGSTSTTLQSLYVTATYKF